MLGTASSLIGHDHHPDDFARQTGRRGIGSCNPFALCVLMRDVLVPGNDMMAYTISVMAAGQMCWIVDMGILSHGSAIILLGLGTTTIHPGGLAMERGVVRLVIPGMTIFLVGFRDEYGNGDQETGETHHFLFVYLLGVLFAVVPWLMSKNAAQIFGGHRRTLRVGAALWLVAAPWFLFVPTGYDGLHERMTGLVGFVSIAALSHLPIVVGRIVLVAQGRVALA